MIDVIVTDTGARTMRNGGTRTETWGAKSVDERWVFYREESPGTPWIVTRSDIGGWYTMFGSLPKAQAGAERALGWDLARGLMRLAGHP